MFIREVKKQRSATSNVFYQYNLVQTSRIEGKVKQRVILYLGSDPLLRDKSNRTKVLELLKGKIFKQPSLFDTQAPKPLIALSEAYYNKYVIKYGEDANGHVSTPPDPQKAEYENVDIKGLEVTDVKTFGGENLCTQVLEKLRLRDCLSTCGFDKHLISKSLISIVARALFAASEHKTSQILAMNSELQHCFDYEDTITHKELYAVSDALYKHRVAIDKFLYHRLSDLFGLDDKLVIFDISNTYFQTSKHDSDIAKFGRSKEKRNDCPLAVFTGVIDQHGFMRHSRTYQGNKADCATMEDMLSDLEQYRFSTKKPTVVIDAGIATDENLEMIKAKGYHYMCVSRHRLNDSELEKIDTSQAVTQLTNRQNDQVTLKVFSPENHNDTWMYVQSNAKKQKEQSIDKKLTERFLEELNSIKTAIHKKGGVKRSNKVAERIGRLKEKYKRIANQYQIDMSENEGKASDITWELKPKSKSKESKLNGVYFIRTSYEDPLEEEMWEVYNTIRGVESTFRCLKTDLNIRPIHHQNDERIQAHIYLTILAYQLVNAIGHMLKKNGINDDWKNIIRTMSTQTIQTVELPTKKKNIGIRQVSKPIQKLKQIYEATSCKPSQPPVKKYVVYH